MEKTSSTPTKMSQMAMGTTRSKKVIDFAEATKNILGKGLTSRYRTEMDARLRKDFDTLQEEQQPDPIIQAALADDKPKYAVEVEPKDTPIDAFNPDGDALADVTREELLEELGKTDAGIETVNGKVVVDGVTGEESMVVPNDGEDQAIDSLQSLDSNSMLTTMTELSRQYIELMLPLDHTDERKAEFTAMLEEKLPGMNPFDIEKMSTDKMLAFVGEDVYKHIKGLGKNPCAALKNILVELRNSMVEKNRISDSIADMNAGMEFFKSKPIGNIQEDLKAEMEADPSKYPTEFHQYQEYLTRYIAVLMEGQSNNFIRDEMVSATKKLEAVNDILTNKTLTTKLPNYKADIINSFKDIKHVDITIQNFIGFLNTDQSINVSFPVPKTYAPTGSAEDTLKLASIWILFVELIVMYKKFPALIQMNQAEYFEIAQLVISPKKDSDLTDHDKELLAIIEEHKITIADINFSRNGAIAFAYVLARLFKPKNLDDYKKNVLSYIMNIITRSMDINYLKLAHSMLDVVLDTFKD